MPLAGGTLVDGEGPTVEVSNPGVFVITGGGGALAAAVAEVFRAAGAALMLADARGDGLAERAERLGAAWHVADLTSPGAAAAMAGEAEKRFGRVDGLIHLAGGFAFGGVLESDDAHLATMLDGNLRSLHNAVRAVLPRMLARGDGFVAGISSSVVWSGAGAAGMTAYAAAKAGVAYYLRSLDAEMRRRGVRVSVVYPLAPIDTPANRRAMPDADPATWVAPTAIGEALLFASTRPTRGRIVDLPVGVAR
jgi:NADP-dependent 3-hydroxy acid dehydrogenase YdfG